SLLRPTLFPYTTLFRSSSRHCVWLARWQCEFDSPSGCKVARSIFVFGSRSGAGMAESSLHMASFAASKSQLALIATAGLGSCPRSEEHTSELQSRFDLV